MKYKVGDRVRVREDLVIDELHGVHGFIFSMASKSGRIVTIEQVLRTGYHIKEDERTKFMWTDEMFTDVNTKEDLKTGDVIELRCGSRLVFVSEIMGFIGIDENVLTNRKEYCFIESDFKHFQGIEKFDVVKVYRPIQEFVSDIVGAIFSDDYFELVYEEKELTLYTLEEAAETGKKFKHKNSFVWYSDPLYALKRVVEITGLSIFEVLKLKEFVVEGE